jgi:predicted trehalose synthase
VVTVRTGDVVATCQVPLTYRAEPLPAPDPVGLVETDEGARWVYDGPSDPVFVAALQELLVHGGSAGTPPGPLVLGVPARAPGEAGPRPGAGGQVLSGEQSNTSVILDRDGPDPAIVKLFRTLHDGANPDVVVQPALAAGGSDRVARPLGWLEGAWTGPDSEPARGHLAYACEFLAGSADAWRVACAAIEAGASFAAEAGELGRATADVHGTLARVLPTVPITPEELARIAAGLADRIHWAVREAPALEPFADLALTRLDEVSTVKPLQALQQVHGDLHLGQVLHSPARGWILLDFEGEPLRPLAQRMEPDLALRDVAGMLRSFDYAARHATLGLPPDDERVLSADAWADDCRRAFLDGYAAVAGYDPRAEEGPLLRALELDKTFYEVVYETRNRPGWIEVPLAAVRRALG